MKRVIVSAMTLFFIVSFIRCGANNKEGRNIMDVSVDYVQGINYGEAIIKLSYDEDEITFSGFDFLNNTDLSY